MCEAFSIFLGAWATECENDAKVRFRRCRSRNAHQWKKGKSARDDMDSCSAHAPLHCVSPLPPPPTPAPFLPCIHTSLFPLP